MTVEESRPKPVPCFLYSSGHAVHWIPALRTANDPRSIERAWRGVITELDGEVIVVDGERGVLRYRNHDPARVRFAVEHSGPDALLSTPDYPILRLDDGWCFSVRLDAGEPLREGCRYQELDPSDEGIER